ncbi:homocysteine biosynthesis protein [Cyanobium sp. WAJ14-Wanaka]|uniref:homocysteine biosynthesis protein n=1 Tax=Cyanobium sp. WAJ14-Wanaka TaxID=2823725 RepID=UPI0020CD8087|nr:homocysteine biosynthesis protein [Cyanobium sp. WAJ14-Wanaka]MCP9774195.1 hypothetical protein [Cyanobium sp. WAJ14-Wanaka]
MSFPVRTEAQLRQKQERGVLSVCSAAEFRKLVAQHGMAPAYAATDVVVAADACFTDQASLHLGLGASEPPIRFRQALVGGVSAATGHGSSELVLAIGGGLGEPKRLGGAQVLAALIGGQQVSIDASGEATALHPRRELHSQIQLEQLATGRLLLHRAIAENGVVAVSSAEGLTASPYGPLLGPFANALYSCAGAGSIGLTMPGLALLGPGSPVLVGGAIGWVVGSGSGHQPKPKRQASGHALSPGCSAAVAVDLHPLRSPWVRACFFEGHGSALLIATAVPVPLINRKVAEQAAADNASLQAPVLDLALPRRLKPNLGLASYDHLLGGQLELNGQRLSCAPAHSPRLAEAHGEELARQLRDGRFPLRLPPIPLGQRPSLLALDD